TYEYSVFEGDTLFTGDFEFQRSNLETALQKRDTSFVIQGRFEQGIANGPWQFQFNEFESERQGKLIDFEYRLLVSGIQEDGSGKIREGRPHGKWLYQVNRVEASQIEAVLFKSEITFEAGIPQQNFKIEGDKKVLIGRFLRNGLAHDEWSLITSDNPEDTESWFFEEGLLRRIVRMTDGRPKEIAIFGKSDTIFKAVPLDRNYLNVVGSLIREAGDSLRRKTGFSGLLLRNHGYYKKLNLILEKLGSTGFVPEYRVKVPYYPLDSVELEQLNDIASDYRTARKIADLILTNSHLNIVRRSDIDADFFYKSAVAINRTYLDPLASLMTAQKEGTVEYLDLPKVLGNLWPNGRPKKQFNVKIDSSGTDRTFELPDSDKFTFEGDDLQGLRQKTAYARASMESIEEALSDQLTTEESLQALNSLEENLIAKNDSLVSLIDSYEKRLPAKYGKSLKRIKSFAEISLGGYATTTNADQKLIKGNTLSLCMNQLLRLTKNLSGLPDKISEVDSLYTDEVWNPFMATIMDEQVKKRITQAYSEKVIPYFLERVTASLSCDVAEEVNGHIPIIHEQVVSLRDKDTKKLERKLRRQKNPEKVLTLLEQATTTKEKTE
ncbi:MAG: hypothetical protein WBG48_15315, partial [Pricia sp.]